MSAILPDKDRLMIPRWRGFGSALMHGELDPSQGSGVGRHLHAQTIEHLVSEWKNNRSLPFAGDLIAAALIAQEYAVAREAAEFVLSQTAGRNQIAGRVAEVILGRGPGAPRATPEVTAALRRDQVYGEIRGLKRRTQEEPRNVFTWVDLARAYTSIGQDVPAARCMHIATTLAPENRFILRSAARRFIHVGEVDRATRLLRASARLLHDPWLLAVDLSLGELQEGPSPNVRKALRLIESNTIAPRHATELASALGTSELKHGKAKLAKKLFQASLIEPTENAVAQAEWARRSIPSLNVLPFLGTVEGAFEAKALEASKSGEWETALKASMAWFWDQPFSGKPAILGSYIAEMCLQSPVLGAEIARLGLLANPDDAALRNNLAVALADSGVLDEARAELGQIELGALNAVGRIVFDATSGLIEFRSGNLNRGRTLYWQAIESAKRQGLTKHFGLACAYLGREESRHSLEKALAAIALSEAALKAAPEADLSTAIEMAKGAVSRAGQTPQDNQPRTG